MTNDQIIIDNVSILKISVGINEIPFLLNFEKALCTLNEIYTSDEQFYIIRRVSHNFRNYIIDHNSLNNLEVTFAFSILIAIVV